MQEALAGLPGVAAVEVDLQQDLCHVTYDPARVSPGQLLEAVQSQGFRGELRGSGDGG